MMNYTVRYHPDVHNDLKAMDKSVRKKVLKKIDQLAQNPEMGQLLGNKAGIKLSGYRKLYADKKRIRIIYRIENEELYVMIIAVGKRESLEIYQIAGRRLAEG